jgi:ABC-2 type transport system ATP-binding protein
LIEFEKLTKIFKTVTAVSELSLKVDDAEIFGLLGPNGAGKTTTLMMLCSILRPTSGTIRVDQLDVRKDPEKVRGRLGIAFQEPVLDSRLTVERNLEFHADACRIPHDLKKQRIKEVLTYMDMWDSRNQKAGKLSGGMKKKVEDSKLFVQEPPVAIFDEPTAYLDVTSRLRVWKRIESLKDQGSTIILATNMMDEAERLSNRLGILSKGKLVAEGTPASLKDELPRGDVIEIQLTGDTQAAIDDLTLMAVVKQVIPLKPPNKLRLYVDHAETNLPVIMDTLVKHGLRVDSVVVKEPSLDDVFLHFTGETL